MPSTARHTRSRLSTAVLQYTCTQALTLTEVELTGGTGTDMEEQGLNGSTVLCSMLGAVWYATRGEC